MSYDPWHHYYRYSVTTQPTKGSESGGPIFRQYKWMISIFRGSCSVTTQPNKGNESGGQYLGGKSD